MSRAVYQIMKERGVVMGRVDESEASREMNRISGGPVTSTSFAGNFGAKGWPSCPAADDCFAGLVRVYGKRGHRLYRRDGQSLALLDVENGVIGEDETGAVLILFTVFLGGCLACVHFSAPKLLVEDDL